MRDHNGFVRVNNFALPSDVSYFQHWSVMGGAGPVVADTELPWGTLSEERQAQDTRAVGLLLYQLLASRTPGTSIVEPRPDGRLNFQRNVPPEVCEAVARAVARQHPNAISTPEALFVELRSLADLLEPALPAASITTGQEEPVGARQFSAAGGKLATALPVREGSHPVTEAPLFRPAQAPRLPASDGGPSSLTVADQQLHLSSQQRSYPEQPVQPQGRSTLLLILLICLIVFVVLFIVGFLAGQHLLPH
jgi:hypothetical protein